MHLRTLPIALTVALLVACQGNTDDTSLPRAEDAAIAAAADSLLAAAAADSLDIHSLIVVRDGAVAYERWTGTHTPDEAHILNSVSKTFTALGTSLAVAEGALNVDDRLVDLFPEYAPDSVSDNLAAITLHHLLTMSCGHATDHTGEVRNGPDSVPWVQQFMSYPVEYAPGEVFCYNTIGTTMLSAAIQKKTGEKLVDYLQPRLFEPLGITGARWEEGPDSINVGGWGLYLTTEDLAKVGQLILQKGQWKGRQIVPAEWIEAMTSRQVDSSPAGENSVEVDTEVANPDWVQGYGYQMWMCRNNAYRADGAGGQYIIILPEKNAVVAITAQLEDMQAEINLVWRYLLPVL